MTSPELPKVLQIGPVLLDTAARTLEVDGSARHLEPKAFDLLLLLIQERHRAVSKDELLERIWTGRVVVEGALKRTVGLIRQALDDDPREPRFLRTVHGVGYQFVASVTEPPAIQIETPQPLPLRQTMRRRLGWLAAGLAAALLMLVGYANLWRDATGIDAGAVRALILPFENATGDDQLNWIERGLPGLAIHALVEEPGLTLIAAEPAERIARELNIDFNAELDLLIQLREMLGADFLVMGRVEGAPQAWRLDLRILDASGRVLMRQLDAAELSALATDHGFRELRAQLLGTTSSDTVRALSFDPYINETYARAAAARDSGDSSRARDLLAVVVRETPQDLHALMDLVEVEHRLGERARLAELMQPLEAAVAEDPLSVLAARLHAHRGTLAEDAGDFASARASLLSVLEIAEVRGDRIAEADALRLLGRLASREGDLEQAESQLGRALTVFATSGYEPGRAMTLSHLALVHWRRGNAVESRRHYELALASFERQGRRDGVASMQGNLANIDFELGDAEAALTRYRNALAVHRELGNQTSELTTLGNLVRTSIFLGRDSEAREHAEAMLVTADQLGDARHMGNARMSMAEVASSAGDSEAALRWHSESAEYFLAAGMRGHAQAARSKQLWELAEAGDAVAARRVYDANRDLLQEQTTAYMRCQVLGAEAALAEAEGRIDDSIAHLSAGREVALTAGLATNANWFTARLALQLLRAGRLEDAEQWVGRVDDLDGSFSDAFLVRARHAYERGDFPAAVALKKRMREVAGQGWLDRHQQQLDHFRSALAEGTRIPLGDELL